MSSASATLLAVSNANAGSTTSAHLRSIFKGRVSHYEAILTNPVSESISSYNTSDLTATLNANSLKTHEAILNNSMESKT